MSGTKDFEVGRRRTRVVVVGCGAFAVLMAGLLLMLPGVPRDTTVTAYAVQDGDRILVQYLTPAGEQLRRLYVEETDGQVSVRAVVTSQPWRPWPGAEAGQPELRNAVVELSRPLDGREVVGLDGTPLAQTSTLLLLDAGPTSSG